MKNTFGLLQINEALKAKALQYSNISKCYCEIILKWFILKAFHLKCIKRLLSLLFSSKMFKTWVLIPENNLQ